jgi:ribose/xylose/arabinose/galactoside ABC-type transport system permease subunit
MNLFFILKNYVGVTVGVGVGVFVGVFVGVGVTHSENDPFIAPLANNSTTTWS